jgi:hypothetical protein
MSTDVRHPDLKSMRAFTFPTWPVKLRAVLVKRSTMVGVDAVLHQLGYQPSVDSTRQTASLLLLLGVVCQRAGYGVSER